MVKKLILQQTCLELQSYTDGKDICLQFLRN